MIDRDKTIKGLECCTEPSRKCPECPYVGEGKTISYCSTRLTKDALALLKKDKEEMNSMVRISDMMFEELQAKEPRVMTLEEIDDDDAYWFEEKYGKKSLGRNVLIHSIEEDAREPYITLVYTYGEASYKISEYGQTWRLWTSRPTDEQREAVPWQE